MIKIVIADDQTLFRKMLEEMLKLDKEIEILASVENGNEALRACTELKPDILLLDIQMPLKTGLETLVELKSVHPSVKVVMLTTFEDEKNIRTCCLHGADGYLVKDMKPDVLVMAIKCIYHELVIMHHGVYSIIKNDLSSLPITNEEKFEIGEFVLDSMDIQIIKQIAEGRKNKEIAQSLNYSEGTIKNKVSRILSVTNLSDRTQISVFAIKNNLI